jgi:muramidase (phage lysozyme)
MPSMSVEEAGGKQVLAFLDLISWSEGTSTSPVTQDGGYDVIVSGIDGHHRMADYDDHPFAPAYGRAPIMIREEPLLVSTASGRYQLLYHFWADYKALLKLADFSPLSQDRVALQQIRERHAVGPLLSGDVRIAVLLCANIWASLPGNSYEQPGGKSLAELESRYQAYLS